MIDVEELPSGWKVMRLADPGVALLNPKKSEVKNVADATEVTFVPMSAVDEGSGSIARPESRKLGAVRKGYTYFSEGDVIFAKITPCMENGKCAIAQGLRNKIGFGSTEFHVLRASAKTVPEWLHLILRSQQVRHDAENAMHGAAGQQRVPVEFLEQLEIPIPPLAEQLRLVARIQSLTSRLEQAGQARRAALAEAGSVVKAAVANLFSDSDCWKFVRNAISSKKGAVRNGPFGSQLLHHEFTKAGVAAIGTRDVQTNRFELKSGWYISPEKFEQFRRYRIFPGDVLCTIVGASIGRFCVVPDDVPLAFTTKHIQALTLNPEAAIPGFVSLILNFHPRCRKSMFSQVDGSAQPSLNATKVLETELPLPPVVEQRRIVSRLDALAAKQAEMHRLQADTEAELAAFTPALLAKVFRGDL